MKAYKLFKIKNEKLYPLYIYANEEIPMGVWINAKVGQTSKDGKHVKSKLGDLALRPGWHSTDIPLADHIGTKQADGILAQSKDTVWCEIEVSDEINYTEQARMNGTNKDGKVVAVKACLKTIPIDGFYFFQTNPLAKAKWIISGAIKVNRILENKEVAELCIEAGFNPQPIAV